MEEITFYKVLLNTINIDPNKEVNFYPIVIGGT